MAALSTKIPEAPQSKLSLGLPTQALKNVAAVVAFGVAPFLLFAAVLLAAVRSSAAYGLEFRGNLWQPGRLILDGHSPYEPRRLDAAEAAVQHGHTPPDLASLAQAVYPAPTHVLFAPFSVLPFGLAMAVFLALSVAAVAASLWVLGVRDWRCFGASFGSFAVFQDLKLGGITAFLLLGLALLWRYRDRVWPASLVLGSLVVVKVFMWPMALWLLATGRKPVVLRGGVIAVAIAVVGWAVIGFRGLLGYPHLLSTLASLEQNRGDSLVAGGMRAGLSAAESRLAAIGVGIALLAVMVSMARRAHERQSFVVALAAAFALTPIVWPQYFMLTLVPIAIFRPRLSLAWGIPLLLWLAPDDGAVRASAYQIAAHQSVLALTVGFSFLALRQAFAEQSQGAHSLPEYVEST